MVRIHSKVISVLVLATWCAAVLGASETRACVVCVPYPKVTHADTLLASENVVLAREDPARPFTLAVVEVLKGSIGDDSTGVFLPSVNRRQLKLNAADGIVLVQRDGAWERLTYASPEYKAFIGEILAHAVNWRGDSGARSRFDYFASRLNDEHAGIRRQAYLEVGRAPYDWIKTVALEVPVERLRANLADYRFIEWHRLYILMLGQSKEDRDRAYIREKFERAAHYRSTINLSAWATAYVEAYPAVAIDRIENWYFKDAERTRAELEEILRAFSVLTNSDRLLVSQRTAELRRRLAGAYASLLEHHPGMSGWVANDLRRWERRVLVERLKEIRRNKIALDPASAFAVDSYLKLAAGFAALDSTH